MRHALLPLAATLIFPFFLTAQDGVLDPTFSGDGHLTYDVGGNDENGMDIAVRPDGKIWVLGTSYDGTADANTILLMRYNADGTLDGTFDEDGVAAISAGEGYTFGTSLALRPGGHLVIGGYFIDDLGYSHPLVIQVDANGDLDAGFGAAGLVIGDNDNTRITDIGVQSDGTLFFTAAGPLELTPGTGSVSPAGEMSEIEVYHICGTHNRFNALTVTPDDRILITGSKGYGEEGGANFIVPILALNADRTPDLAFSEGYICGELNLETPGIEYYDSGNPAVAKNDVGNDIVELPNGDILVGGASIDTADQADVYRFMLLKVHPDNSVDEDFGLHGFVKSTVGSTIRRIAVQGDGKILAAGYGYENGFLLARFNADGMLDTDFGTSAGHTTSDFGGTANNVQSLGVQPDGRILLVGSRVDEDNDIVIARYNGTATSVAEEYTDSGTLAAFPNPSTDRITVVLPAQAQQFRLLDAAGRLLRTEDVRGRSRLDLQLDTPGTYVLQTNGPAGRSVRSVVVL